MECEIKRNVPKQVETNEYHLRPNTTLECISLRGFRIVKYWIVNCEVKSAEEPYELESHRPSSGRFGFGVHENLRFPQIEANSTVQNIKIDHALADFHDD